MWKQGESLDCSGKIWRSVGWVQELVFYGGFGSLLIMMRQHPICHQNSATMFLWFWTQTCYFGAECQRRKQWVREFPELNAGTMHYRLFGGPISYVAWMCMKRSNFYGAWQRWAAHLLHLRCSFAKRLNIWRAVVAKTCDAATAWSVVSGGGWYPICTIASGWSGSWPRLSRVLRMTRTGPRENLGKDWPTERTWRPPAKF